MIAALVAVLVAAGAATHWLAPPIAAGALLHPVRNRAVPDPPSLCVERTFDSGIALRGWFCKTDRTPRGTVIYLHGIADNRGSGVGAIRRYLAHGFHVVAYDSRAHGLSDGENCTYGYFEKHDLRAVISTLPPGPVVLLGTSLGAAVAVQTAALEPRVSVVVAAEIFSDLETIARDRAPFFVPVSVIRRAFRIAERRASFRVREVTPIEAARQVRVPVLVIHGASDRETAPVHSRRVYEALAGPKRLLLVRDAGHNRSLSGGEVWREIDSWIRTATQIPQPAQSVPQ